MKQSMTFLFVIACTILLAAHETQAKRGCNAYGHACYGGHGKRSLGAVEEEVRPDTVQLVPSEVEDDEITPYQNYLMTKMFRQMIGGRTRRFLAERQNDFDYPLNSGEVYKENIN